MTHDKQGKLKVKSPISLTKQQLAERTLIATIWSNVYDKHPDALVGNDKEWEFWLELLHEGGKIADQQIVDEFFEEPDE